jgi:hypothetical protein
MKSRQVNIGILGWNRDLIVENTLDYIDVYNMVGRYPSTIQIQEYLKINLPHL